MTTEQNSSTFRGSDKLARPLVEKQLDQFGFALRATVARAIIKAAASVAGSGNGIDLSEFDPLCQWLTDKLRPEVERLMSTASADLFGEAAATFAVRLEDFSPERVEQLIRERRERKERKKTRAMRNNQSNRPLRGGVEN